MKPAFLASILVVFLGYLGCYGHKIIEPDYPTSVAGWKYHVEDNGLGIVGEFVLKNGESTADRDLKVTIVAIKQDDSVIETAGRRVRIRFDQLSSGRTLCEEWYPVGGGNICGTALNDFGISGISVRRINLSGDWVYFALTGVSDK